MSGILRTLGLISVFCIFAPYGASACTCNTPYSPSGNRDMVDVVFVGKVTSVEHIDADGWLYGAWKSMLGAEHLYEFETLRVALDVGTAIKGTDKPQLIVETPATTEMCGVLFREGEEYLVYGFNGVADTVTTDMCQRTATSTKAESDINSLVNNEIKPICEGWTCIND